MRNNCGCIYGVLTIQKNCVCVVCACFYMHFESIPNDRSHKTRALTNYARNSTRKLPVIGVGACPQYLGFACCTLEVRVR